MESLHGPFADCTFHVLFPHDIESARETSRAQWMRARIEDCKGARGAAAHGTRRGINYLGNDLGLSTVEMYVGLIWEIGKRILLLLRLGNSGEDGAMKGIVQGQREGERTGRRTEGLRVRRVFIFVNVGQMSHRLS
jgi:hypothetical protein